jgi:hypothetical protein
LGPVFALGRLQPGDVLLGDAFYVICFLLAELKQRGVNGVSSRPARDAEAQTTGAIIVSASATT